MSKHSGKWLKRIVLAATLAGLAAVMVLALLPEPVLVDLAPVTRGPMRVTVNEDGKTRVENRYTIAAPLPGNMLRLGLLPGDPVEAGQVLTRILPTAPPLLDARTRAEAQARLAAALASQRQAQAQVARARVAHEHAKSEAERQRRLAARNAAPRVVVEQAGFEERARAEELNAAELGVKVAAQAVMSARAALGLLQDKDRGTQELDVSAPVSGQILRVLREDEGPVQAGTPLVEIGDPASLEVVVDVLTADAVLIRPRAPVSIVRWSRSWDGDQALAGHVDRVEPSAFTRISALGVEEQRVNVVIDIDEPREHWTALGDGFRVEVRIVVWEDSDVLSVPASAVFRHDTRWAVYQVRDGVAHLVPVEVGQRNDDRVQILSGLDQGDRLVVHPSDRVSEGVEIAARGR